MTFNEKNEELKKQVSQLESQIKEKLDNDHPLQMGYKHYKEEQVNGEINFLIGLIKEKEEVVKERDEIIEE